MKRRTQRKTAASAPGRAAPRARNALRLRAPTARLRASSPLVSELTFVGCDPVPVNYDQYVLLREAKRRFELWDRQAGCAWEVREGPTGVHEWPIQALHEMMVYLGVVRGIRVPCFGNRGLALLDDDGQRLRVLHPDQSVYLTPPVRYDGHGDIPLQQSGFPDIVMEVDNTTDTRKGKLKLYEDMGVPELWIEVPKVWLDGPDAKPPQRPPGLVPRLTIFLLKDGRYAEYPASRALLGWQAADIHEALNDYEAPAPHHCAILEDIGRRFGAYTGTGSDNHPLLRSLRQQSRVEGQAKMVRGIVERRGIALSPTFPADVPQFADRSVDGLLEAAMACADEQDFRARLR